MHACIHSQALVRPVAGIVTGIVQCPCGVRPWLVANHHRGTGCLQPSIAVVGHPKQCGIMWGAHHLVHCPKPQPGNKPLTMFWPVRLTCLKAPQALDVAKLRGDGPDQAIVLHLDLQTAHTTPRSTTRTALDAALIAAPIAELPGYTWSAL